MFAKRVEKLFKQVFNCRLLCMKDYNITELSTEDLMLVVTSTFGNGDAPENGEVCPSYCCGRQPFVSIMYKLLPKWTICGKHKPFVPKLDHVCPQWTI